MRSTWSDPQGVARCAGFDVESVDWIGALTGPDREAATARLHSLLLRVARTEIRRRSHLLGVSGPEMDDLAFQATADAIVAIDHKMTEFRGESRFTTWACRFVILEVMAKLSRHFWRNRDVAMNAGDWDRLPDQAAPDPADTSERQEFITALRRAVDTELTGRQRSVFVSVVVDEIPPSVLAKQLGSNRNAIYKTIFDARRRLRGALVASGLMDGFEPARTRPWGMESMHPRNAAATEIFPAAR